MNTGTRLIIGLTIIALGLGVISLGFIEQEDTVRMVDEVVAAPAAHTAGTYTLMGTPQPKEVPVTGPNGTMLVPNDDYSNQTQTVVGWTVAGVQSFSTITITVDVVDGVSYWQLDNITRVPGTDDTVVQPTVRWTIDRPHHVFQVHSFETRSTIWAVYDGVLSQPMQPKPSQFEGRLATTIPTAEGDADMPQDGLVYMVDDYTAGCSSKFLPPELQDEYADDPDFQ